ncbi:MAG TPA: helix-turn-helix domain-containing protein [Thermoanaerobaculia bacterium]|nr:helix-turn-helix domain-containing protein [Thermoanaerobaculia bacterium]
MPPTNIGPPPPLGFVLRHLREEAGWTQTQLEEAAGLPPTAVSKMERGIRSLSRMETERLARIMGYPDGWVDRTLAAADQLPRRQPPDDSPTALSEAEHRVVEGLALAASRRLAGAVRKKFGPVLQAARWQADRKAAGKVWKRLSRATKEDRIALVGGSSEFQTWAVCERLCFESIREAPHDADQAHDLAELALTVAERSPGNETWRNVLIGFALAFVANSWRVLGDFQKANRTMQRSEELFNTKEGAFGPLDPTRVLALRAVLWKYQRRYEDALDALGEAMSISVRSEQRTRLLINKASVLKRKEDFVGAVQALREAAGLAEKAADDRLHVVIAFNEATYLCDFGRFGEAEVRLAALRKAAFQSGKGLDILRLQWLEARIASGLGKRAEAAASLSEVWEAFADRKLWFEASLAALELASIELDRGRTRAVRLLAASAAPVFAAQDFPDELLASLTLFWEAARREVASAETARLILKELRRVGREAGEA